MKDVESKKKKEAGTKLAFLKIVHLQAESHV